MPGPFFRGEVRMSISVASLKYYSENFYSRNNKFVKPSESRSCQD
jgi:hypothetical protein